MLTIRAAHPGELPALTTYPDDEERNAATAAYLAGLLEAGCTRPEWCLVAERDGRLVGNVVLWTIPGRTVPMDLVLLEPGDADTGEALLAYAAEQARELGADTQGHVLDSPAQAPQFQRDPELREKLLLSAGFTVARDGCRFLWTADDSMPVQDSRLHWRSLVDLGQAPFVELLADTFTETKDSIFQAEIAEHGVRGAAERNFAEMLEMIHEPGWFEIGYDAAGTPVAVSLPARTPTSAVIGLVAVARAGRGQGYATSVVARGTQVLADAGATEIRGDCDAGNIAMFKAFQRAGFRNFANRKMFTRSL
ncbi:MAG: GNAT family N-acetyltransferase [Hamadaea sp.]|uniref:GNAT family N-acetyltransferase n=1 Tax=Hamadaea sp. TaxID=2024425 RepID=UPI0017FAB539|nr:GNAT family N-acetyltransferase [Hamadaea sp.]NUR74108.1 GNAT family N-acetyltransferase [Hamadaea sp.]NUT19985.1 GNAT family N-acetyltransferase [Hamadaea sp.]